MPKSRKRKKKSLQSGSKSGFQIQKMPRFSSEEHEIFKKTMLEYAMKQPARFTEAANEIEDIFRQKDPTLVLSLLANYGLQGFIADDGSQQQGPFGKEGFNQHHAELCQAIFLRVKKEEVGEEFLASDVLEKLVCELKNMAEAFSMQRLIQAEEAESTEHRALIEMQERLRLQTQVLRNWGSYGQVIDISTQLFAGLNDEFKTHFGLTTTTLIKLFEGLVSRVEDKNSARLSILAESLHNKLNANQMIERYFELNPHFKGTADDFKKNLPTKVSRANVMALIFNHSDFCSTENFVFSASEASEIAGVAVSDIQRILDLLAIESGELVDSRIEYLLLDNPIWTRPIVKLSEGEYFLPIPQAFFSHIHRIFAHLSSEASLGQKLETVRATYLEAKALQIIKDAFPNGKTYSNVKWKSGSAQFETDIIVIIDRTMLIVEAKSGVISDPALRGAPDRAKRHIGELVFEPSLQAERLQRLVEQSQGGDIAAQKTLNDAGIWPLAINRILRLGVTLDDLSVIASAEKDLKSLGWIENSHDLAPSMTLSDLEVIGKVLKNEANILHYISERSRLQKSFDIVADELDWLGFYLETGFAIAASEKKMPDKLILTGLSEPIDDYFNSLDRGISIELPSPKNKKLWVEMLNKMQTTQKPGWIEDSIALIRAASFDEQHKIQREFRRILRRMGRNQKNPPKKNGISILPKYDQAIAVILFGHLDHALEEQRNEALGFAQSCFERSDVERCLVIGFNAKKPHNSFDYKLSVGRTPESLNLNC